MTDNPNDINWHNFLPPLRPERKPRKRVQISTLWRTRYEQAYQRNFRETYPDAYKDHGYHKTTFPDTRKANGLTQAIIKFLLWEGCRATRITSAGRMIGDKFIPGTTRRGAADISATIRGRSVQLEIKVGSDKPSHEQLREKELEEKAGGVYIFIHNMDEFFIFYDNILNQTT